MPDPTPSFTDIERLVRESGFPFELQVAASLQALGFAVHLSHQYFDEKRQRPAEVDVLATRESRVETSNAGPVRVILELAVECKDNSLPYVLFGFPQPAAKAAGILDGDVYYSRVRSTQDKFPNFFAVLSLGDERLPGSEDIKASHHHFAGSHRFHQVTSIEKVKDNSGGFFLKLHASDRFREALHGLAGYVHYVNDALFKASAVFGRQGYPHDPTIWLTFLLLVHSGDHYRFTTEDGLVASSHTPLLTSLNFEGLSQPYAVDFVRFEDLAAAINTIDSTFQLVSDHLVKYLSRSPRPVAGST